MTQFDYGAIVQCDKSSSSPVRRRTGKDLTSGNPSRGGTIRQLSVVSRPLLKSFESIYYSPSQNPSFRTRPRKRARSGIQRKVNITRFFLDSGSRPPSPDLAGMTNYDKVPFRNSKSEIRNNLALCLAPYAFDPMLHALCPMPHAPCLTCNGPRTTGNGHDSEQAWLKNSAPDRPHLCKACEVCDTSP